MADSPFANLGLNFLNWSSVPSLSEAVYAGQKGQKTLGGQLLGSALIGLAGDQSTVGQIGKDLQGQGAVLPSRPAATPSVPAPVTAAPPAAPMVQPGVSQPTPQTGAMQQPDYSLGNHPLFNSAMKLLGLGGM